MVFCTCVCVCRRGHDDLGDHYLDCGDLTNALKCYSRARDYCTNPKHVVNMCLNVIKVSQVFAFEGSVCFRGVVLKVHRNRAVTFVGQCFVSVETSMLCMEAS